MRGGNLFFMRDEDDVKQVFGDEFDYMVSELAHDLAISITPQPGYTVAGVYGVPDSLMGWQNERTVKINLPTVFLSSKGGALFVALAKSREDANLPARPVADGAPLASVQLQYVPLSSGIVEADRIDAFAPSAKPSDAMKLGHALIDEFTVLRRSTTAHYIENDQELAYQLVHALATRLSNDKDEQVRQGTPARLRDGGALRVLVRSRRASRGSVARQSQNSGVCGKCAASRGDPTLRPYERLEFTPGAQFRRYRKEGSSHVLEDESEFGANRRQISIDGLGLVYDYEVRGGNELVLADAEHQNLVFLQRRKQR